MPKTKASIRSKLLKAVHKYKSTLKVDQFNVLMCTVCDESINYDENHIEDRVVKHNKKQRHQKRLEGQNESQGRQQFIATAMENAITSERKNEYFAELTKAFLSADIPLHKLENSDLKVFLEKYTKKDQPRSQTLRNYYVKDVYDSNIEKIHHVLDDHDFYLLVDETQDVSKDI